MMVNQQVEQEKPLRASNDNPIQKCKDYLSYLDCTCQIPTYIVQFLELVGQYLEKEEGNPRITRQLPITINMLEQMPINKKKNIPDYPPYEQIDKNERTASILKFESVKRFKQFCQQIYKVKPDEYRHASFTNQDFKYVPSMYKIMYNLNLPKFTQEDIDKICTIYNRYYYVFQLEFRVQEHLKNSKKMFVIIQQIIKRVPYLYQRYSPLFLFIMPESPVVRDRNDKLFEDIWQNIIQYPEVRDIVSFNPTEVSDII